ncbi:MAG: response regulator [Deltaproteobacteria bacterium]|nr:response regulator [Deltaproteobacteria bacterium]
MYIFPSYPLVAFIVSVFGLAFIYGMYRRSASNRALLKFTLFLTMALFFRLLAYLPCAKGDEELLFRASILFFALMIPFFLDFSYRLSNRPRDRAFYLLSGLTIVGGSIYSLTGLVVTGFKTQAFGPILNRHTGLYWLVVSPVLVTVGAGLWLLGKEARRRGRDEGKPVLYFFLASCLALLLFLLLDMGILEMAGLKGIPRFGAVSCFLPVLVVTIFGVRYDYLAPGVEDVAEELIRSIQDGVVITDQKGIITTMNESAGNMLGLEPGQAQGLSLMEVFPQMPVGDDLEDYEIDLSHNGERMVVEISKWTKDASGLRLGSIILLRDVTSRKEAEEFLEKRNKELSREAFKRNELLLQKQKMETIGLLAKGVSHDYNNYLHVMAARAMAAMARLRPGAKGYDELKTVLAQVNRGRELVQQIQKKRNSRQDSKERSSQVAPLVAQVSAILQGMAPENVHINTQLKCGFVRVGLSELMLEQVILNLGKNSLQAMQEKGGTLTLSAEKHIASGHEDVEGGQIPPGNYVMITVQDQGVGISKELKKNIFDPMFTTKPEGEGTGLGLVIARRNAEECGGGIRVESTMGRGTRIVVLLPEIAGQEQDARIKKTGMEEENEKEDGLTGVGRNRGKERNEQPLATIMVVDDMEDVAKGTALMVQNLGYRTCIFIDPVDALKAFQKAPKAFDALVTDLTMPHMNGIELAEHYRALRPDVPTILLSGYAEGIVAEEEALEHVSIFLQKPLSADELKTALQEVLQK